MNDVLYSCCNRRNHPCTGSRWRGRFARAASCPRPCAECIGPPDSSPRGASMRSGCRPLARRRRMSSEASKPASRVLPRPTSSPRRIRKPRMAAERPATASLALRALSMKAAVRARGSRIPNTTAGTTDLTFQGHPAEKPASMTPATAAAATRSAAARSAAGLGSSERGRVPRLLAEKRQKDRR
jgi:hypothetical protein